MNPSLAIAYAMKKKAKKMKDGGDVDPAFWNRVDKNGSNTAEQWGEKANNATLSPYSPEYIGEQKDAMRRAPMKMADGGMIEDDEMESGYESEPEEHDESNEEAKSDDSIVDRIMSKRQMYAEGGVVADEGEDELSHMADSADNDFDYLATGDLDDSSSNSGSSDGDELGNHQEEEDRKDIVARIMRQRSMKQHNPKPA